MKMNDIMSKYSKEPRLISGNVESQMKIIGDNSPVKDEASSVQLEGSRSLNAASSRITL